MSKRRKRFAWIAVAFAVGWPMHVAAQAGQGIDEDAQAASIIEKADRVRFPAEGFEVSVTITTTTPVGPQEPHKYRILSKGNDNTIILTMEPVIDRGQIIEEGTHADLLAREGVYSRLFRGQFLDRERVSVTH